MKTESGDEAPPNSTSKKSPTHYKANDKDVVAAARGRWIEILVYFGIARIFLSGKSSPCPICNDGVDRFQFTDEGRGCWICRRCADSSQGFGFPDGFNMLSAFLGIDNTAAFKLVADYLGLSGNQLDLSKKQLQQNVVNNQQRSAEYEKQKEQEKKLLDVKEAMAITHAISIKKACIIEENHLYLQGKNLKNSVFVTTETYTIPYQQINRAIQKIEERKQFIKAGSIFIQFFDVADLEKIVGGQFISKGKDPKKEPWPKRPIVGTPTRNAIHVLQGDNSSSYVGVVEGYTTGLSVHIATGLTVVMAVDESGMRLKAERIHQLSPRKRYIFFGDNDTHKGHTKGQDAAYKGAALTNGLAIIPPEPGDWDDYRQKHDKGDDKATNTRLEIERQILELAPVNITEKVIGLDINYPILITGLDGRLFSVPFDQAIINYAGFICKCPLSGGKAIINHDSIHSYQLKIFIAPIITALYNKKIIDECKKIKGKKIACYKWAVKGKTPQHIYALILKLEVRFGADIINKKIFYSLLQKHTKRGVSIPTKVMRFIECLIQARLNKASRLTELDTSKLNHSKLNQAIEMINGVAVQRLDWEPGIQTAMSRKYRAIFFKAHHEQGKTKSLFSRLFNDANTRNGGVIIAHLARLINQIADELKCYNYKDWHKELSGCPLSGIGGLACCLHSFKHDHFLDLLMQADSIFIDESVQVLKVLLTSEHRIIDKDLPDKFIAAIKAAIVKGAIVYFADADQTTESIQHWKEIFGLEDKDIFVFTAEPPSDRKFKAYLSCSTNRGSYNASIIKSIEKDLENGVPCVLAVETEKEARIIAEKIFLDWPHKDIVLITGKYCTKNGDEINTEKFTNNIEKETESIDLIIHNSVLGAGFSIKHIIPRFTKGYCLFTGEVLAATECLQMMRRFRDITEWKIGILCCPHTMYMVNPHRDKATEALGKRIALSSFEKMAKQIIRTARKNNALFIPAFNWLLQDYGFEVFNQLPVTELIHDLQTLPEITESDVLKILSVKPCSLKDAKKGEESNYSAYIEDQRYSCYHALILDHYNLTLLTEEAAWRSCRYSSRQQDKRLELLFKILRLDPSIPKVESLNQILLDSGITLELLTNIKQITQPLAEELLKSISRYRLELHSMGVLDEHHCRTPEKDIAPDRPLRFISEWFKSLGYNSDVIETRAGNRDRNVLISINAPMASRLGLEAPLTKGDELAIKQAKREAQKTEARQYREAGLSIRQIGIAMNETIGRVQRLLKE